MYDIIIMITNTPDYILVMDDLATVSFRLSHLNDSMLLWFAGVRLVCVVVTVSLILLYFLTSCKRSGFNINAFMELNLDQCWVLILLFLCTLYNEPFFELRRNNPSTSLAVLAEIPASAFFTALLTYWLMSVAYVRVNEKNL